MHIDKEAEEDHAADNNKNKTGDMRDKNHPIRDEPISEAGKEIKKSMDRYEAKIISAGGKEEESSARPAGDSTRSEE